MYVDGPETYLHLRRSDLMMAAMQGKNAIMILNELYYESAVYTDIETGTEQPDALSVVSVTVDGITVYGRGMSKKAAKLAAAQLAVEQLRGCGILQQRIAAKESAKASTATSDKQVPYRNTVCSVIPENAIAKLNRLHTGLNYQVIDMNMTPGQATSFTVSVNVNGQDFTGTDRSKKSARLAAAENVLRSLNMWTKEDNDAKRLAKLSAMASLKTTGYSVNIGAVRSMRGIRGVPFARAGRVIRGQAMQARGSFSQGHITGPLSAGFSPPGIARGGQMFRSRGSGMLRRGTRGGGIRGRGARGAATNLAVSVPRDKNPIQLLNEVYYAAAVYEYSGPVQMAEGRAPEDQCTVTVDDIVAYGYGPTKKDAKLAAAISAVQQLEAAGILQKRLADKAAFMSMKHGADATQNYYATQSRGVQVQASARMQRGGRGRPVRGRGRAAPRRPGSGVGVSRGLLNTPQHYPQTMRADLSTDFTSFDDSSFVSFEGAAPNRGTAAVRRFRAPQRPNRGRGAGRMLGQF